MNEDLKRFNYSKTDLFGHYANIEMEFYGEEGNQKHMLKSYSGMTHKMTDNNGRPKLDQAIETILNELEKKDKIINEMAEKMSSICTGITVIREQFESCYCEFINSDEDCCWKTDKDCSDCIKEYFYQKAEQN